MVESIISDQEKNFKNQQGGGGGGWDVKEAKTPAASQVESMFYVGEKPWHGLGIELPELATAAEAIMAAGLDWDVKMTSVFVQNLKGHFAKVPDKFAVTRESDGKVFNILGKYYTPVQNRQAFQFFDSVAGTGKAKYETAGSLRGGARIWVMARLDSPVYVKGDEKERIDRYVTLMNCHDGTMALQMFHHPFRVVCWNTLRASMAIGADKFYTRHTSGVMGRIESASEILGITDKFYNEFLEKANHLATHQLPPAEMPLLLAAAFGTTGAIKADIYGPIVREMEKVEVLMETGKGLDNPNIRGTKWAAYNAIAEYTDHAREYRGKNQAEARLNGVWLGGGAAIKDRAWSYLLKS